jgi:SAM-dependent methyltransferase
MIEGTTQQDFARLLPALDFECLKQANIRQGTKILDVGCGNAAFTRLLGLEARVPVVGVERDPQSIQAGIRAAEAAGERVWLDLRLGEAPFLPLTLEELGRFDLAHARFVLAQLPDPAATVRAMVNALKPNGRLILADDDLDALRLHPEPPGFDGLWQAYLASRERRAIDPRIGRKLAMVLHEAGAQPSRVTLVFVGGCYGHDDFLPLIESLTSTLRQARESILATEQIDAAQFARVLQAVSSLAHRPGSAIWYPVCWAEGRRG